MSTVVTLTLNPCLDQLAEVEHVRPNQKLRMTKPRYQPGGGGINVSRAIARFGGQTIACYAAGGSSGQTLGERLEAEHIPHRPVEIDGHTRVNLNAFDQKTDDLYRFIMPGPEVDPGLAERCRDQLAQVQEAYDYIVISGSLPAGLPNTSQRSLIEQLQSSGKRVVLDSSGSALREAIKSGVYLVKPNYREFAELIGEEPDNDDRVRDEARRLIDQHGVRVVFATLGANGALLVTEQETHRIHAPTVNMQSRIGAGDSVVGAIAMRLAQGWCLVDAGRYGVAAGAAAVTTPGTELCRREDTERIYDEIKSDQQNGANP